jgi:Flp pilus assembly protein TadB
MVLLFFAGVLGAVFFGSYFFYVRRSRNLINVVLKGFQQPRRAGKISYNDHLQALWGPDGDLLSLGLSSALGGFIIGYLLLNLLAGAVLAVIAFVFLPRIWTAFLRRQRDISFRAQLPAIIDTMSSVLHAGGTETMAIDGVIEATKPPAQDIFKRLKGDILANTPIETVMDRLAAMVDSVEAKMLADALKCTSSIGHEASIRLLENASEFCRERVRLKQKVNAATADIRYSFLIVSFFPPVMALVMSLTIDQFREVFQSLQGHVLIAVALILILLGHVWVNVLLRSVGGELGL